MPGYLFGQPTTTCTARKIFSCDILLYVKQAPHAVAMRAGLKMGNGTLVDTCVNDGLMDAFHNYHMGITGMSCVVGVNTSCKPCNEKHDIHV